MSARGRRGVAALLMVLLAPPAAADIVLNGHFHTGDDDNKAEFTPLDPVECTKYRSYPHNFHLSQDATITGFKLHDAVDTQNSTITVDIDGTQRSALSCTACDLCEGTSSCGDITVTLTTGVTLSAGDHTVAVVDPSGASGNCLSSNDFGWSKLTLLSTATTTSLMLNRRYHLGDNADGDDDYDFTGNVSTSNGEFYPDAVDADEVDLSFSLGANLRLTQLRFFRLRDVNTESPNNATSPAVLLNGSSIGSLTADGNPFTLAVAGSPLLATGTHTLRVESGLLGFQRDDFSWDGIILAFTTTAASGAPGAFTAVDLNDPVLTGSLRTKTAGATTTLDLYALNAFGTAQDTSFAGLATVDILNAANSSGTTDVYGCNSAWTLFQTLGSATFAGGKAQVTAVMPTAGLKEARIRVTDVLTNKQGCSLDNFAIRPASLAVVATHGTDSTAGITEVLNQVGTSGGPVHRAGAPFTITVTGKASGGVITATNYDGTPDWAEAVIAPATVPGELAIGTWNSASNGSRSTDVARYPEVGAVTLTFTDSTWANVDADDTVAGDRTITGAANVGRFIPDHFKVTEGTLTPACGAGGFSYLGSTLEWATSPTLTARTVDDTTVTGDQSTTTANYAGDLEKLPDSLGQPTYAAYDDPGIPGTPTLDVAGLSVPTIPGVTAGVATVTLPPLKFARALIGAFNAEIQVDVPAFADSDGVAPEESPLVLGSASAAGGVAFAGGFKSQRFGRLYFEPSYGSDRLPMDVPLRAEYFDGIAFVPNSDDACTSLSTSDVALTPVAGQTHSVTANGTGIWKVTLTAPMQAGAATLEIPDTGNPTYAHELLLDDIDADGFDDNPQRTVYFGLRGQEERWIYQRDATAD